MKHYQQVLTLTLLFFSSSYSYAVSSPARPKMNVDICIYGGTSAGVIAAYTAKKMGKTVVLIEPGTHLGGMSSGGLGYTDIGNKFVVTGLAKDFYRRIGRHYGKFEQWIFEPKVAESIFKDYVKLAGFQVLYQHRLSRVKKEGNRIGEILVENTASPLAAANTTIRARVFIDCTYEGDLMARSGVSYAVGREPNSAYQETINGVQLMEGHQFPDQISPYHQPGAPQSGLIWGVSDKKIQENGTGDKKIQAYNFRITLTNVPENRLPITRPENYDPKKYELLLRLKQIQPWKTLKDVFIWSLMPNGKTDINNRGGFSTDMIGMNWGYPEGNYAQRAKIWKAHEDYTKGLLYFIGNDTRIPAHIRAEMKQWGYPKDEYTDNGNWSHQLYVREARRMIGEMVMTQHHCEGKKSANDGIGMAAYTMDSHNCDRHILNGMVKNEGNVEVGGFAPYPIAYRAIIPKQREAANLFVPVCLSATHIAYGSIRMEPVFMVLAQSSAVAACMAIDGNIPVQQVNVNQLQKELAANPLADGSTAEILVDNEHQGNVVIKGDWAAGKRGGYGPSYLMAGTENQTARSVRFIPPVLKAGNYKAYLYFPKLKNSSTETAITIFDGTKVTEQTLHIADIQVIGQTSGEWLLLGAYHLPAGNKAYIEISNKNANGVITADAILLVPEK